MATSDFVGQLYSNIFGRTPSSAELNFWVGRIDLGVQTSNDVALSFINSAEGLRAQTVERMYQATFGRTPDLGGFKVQIGALSATTGALTLDQLAVNFANSAEFQSTFVGTGTFDATKFLTTMYTNILGRAPDAAGLAVQVAAYNGFIAAGKTPAQAQAQMLSNFASSAEFVNNPSINFDKVVLAHAGIDGQIPVSTTAAPNATLQQLAGVPLTTIINLLNDGVPGNGTNTGAITGSTLALTANQDTLVGTGANDLFDGGKADSLNAFDSIDGGNGTDTLNASLAGATLPTSVTIKNVENLNFNSTNAGFTADTTGFTGATKVTVNDGTAGAVKVTAATTTAVNVTATTDAAAAGAVKEVFKATFGATVDADTVTFDGVAVVLTLGQTAIQNAAQFVTAYNGNVAATWVAAANGDGTVTFTNKVGGAVADVTTANFAITSGGAGADITVTAAAPTTQGAAAVAGASKIDVIGGGGDLVLKTGAAGSQNITVGGTAVANALTSVSTTGGDVISIQDRSGTSAATGKSLTTVSLNGNVGAATITANGLTTLSVANTSANATVTAAAGTRALTVNLDGVTAGGTITDATATTLAIKAAGSTTSGGSISAAAATTVSLDSTAKVTLTDLAANAATTLTITGGKLATITGMSAVAALTTIDATASTGGAKITQALGTGVKFTGGTGADNVTVAATTKAIAMGDGNDTVTVNVTALGTGGSVDAGNGRDTLSLTAANAVTVSGTTTFSGSVKNFEILSVAAVGTASTIDLANLNNAGANAIDTVVFSATNTDNVTVANLASGNTVEFDAAQTATKIATLSVANAAASTTDVINVKITNAAATDVKTIDASNIETVNFLADDSATTATNIEHIAALTDAAAKVITVAGTAGLNLTFTGTNLTSFDASGVTTKAAVDFTTGALTSAASIKGGAAGPNTFDFSAATKVVTYTGGTGVDTINFATANTKANVVTLGDGANVFNGGTNANGDNTITGGKDVDTITVGTGNNTITAGAGDDVVTVGSGSNKVTLGLGNDTLKIGAVNTSSAVFTTVTDLVAGDVIDNGALTVWANATGKLGAALTSGVNDYQTFLNAAAGKGTGVVSWFQFGGDTYIVEDVNAAGTFTAGSDLVIKVTGSVDLSNSTLTLGGHTLTIA